MTTTQLSTADLSYEDWHAAMYPPPTPEEAAAARGVLVEVDTPGTYRDDCDTCLYDGHGCDICRDVAGHGHRHADIED